MTSDDLKSRLRQPHGALAAASLVLVSLLFSLKALEWDSAAVGVGLSLAAVAFVQMGYLLFVRQWPTEGVTPRVEDQ